MDKPTGAWAIEAQRLADTGLRIYEVARALGKPKQTVSNARLRGDLTFHQLPHRHHRFQDGRPVCPKCQTAKDPNEFIVGQDGRLGRKPRFRVCKTCHVRDKRARLHRQGVRPAEECRARAIQRRQFKSMIARWSMMLRAEQRNDRRRKLMAAAIKLGVGVSAMRYRRRWRSDADFRHRERERQRTYKHAHPEIAARYGDRRKVRAAAQADGSLTSEVVRWLFAITTECPYCERLMREQQKTLDHMEPLALGGRHALANVIVVCRSCNRRKLATPFGEWLATLSASVQSSFAYLKAGNA